MPAIMLLKLFLVPFLIYMVTLAGRRWGPAVAGWLSAFPIVAGPILLTVALEQGAGFAATAAEGTLLAVVAILVFSIAYAWASSRFGVLGSMAGALFAYALAVAALQAIHPPLGACFVFVWGALLLAPRLFPRVALSAPASPSGGSDLPWRMAAGAVLVLSVTFAASSIGARLSGFFAMFPVMSSVLVGFSHARSGRAFAVALLRGMVFGYYAFSVFCLVAALLLRERSIALAFCVAFACALAVQITVKRMIRFGRPAIGAATPSETKA
jgi:hypothetical protein